MSDRDARELLPLAPQALELLLALAQGPAHGYALIERVAAQSGGVMVLGASTLYATLHRLALDGLVEDTKRGSERSGGPPRRVFRITSPGRRVASLEVVRLRQTLAIAAERLPGRAPGGRG
jgi:DNA-binding PadR family transcriptional regulator